MNDTFGVWTLLMTEIVEVTYFEEPNLILSHCLADSQRELPDPKLDALLNELAFVTVRYTIKNGKVIARKLLPAVDKA